MITCTDDYDKYNDILTNNEYVCVDFYAKWCKPCQILMPHMERISKKYDNIIFMKVDIDECQDITDVAGVSQLPTIKLYNYGKEIDSIVSSDIDDIISLLNKNIGIIIIDDEF